MDTYDREGERESARADAITARGERMAADPVALRDVIEAMLIDTEIDAPELLTQLYLSRIDQPGGITDRARTMLRDLDSAINDAIDKAAEAEVDEAIAAQEQERWARRHLGHVREAEDY